MIFVFKTFLLEYKVMLTFDTSIVLMCLKFKNL